MSQGSRRWNFGPTPGQGHAGIRIVWAETIGEDPTGELLAAGGGSLRRSGPLVGFLEAVLILAQLCDDEGLFRACGTLTARTAAGRPRRLLAQAAWMARDDKAFTAGQGSMAKLRAGELAVAATEKAVQVLGGAGCSREHPVERMYRDAKIYTLFEGASEIQRLVIARAIAGRHLR